MQSSAVFLVVNGQRQLGLWRDQFEILWFAAAICESGPVALARLGTANGELTHCNQVENLLYF